MCITACIVDSREPEWMQKLSFGGIPTTVTMLDTGDIWATTDDGCFLQIERKTPDDFLGSLKEERLFSQMARLVDDRLNDQAAGIQETHWPYLVITGLFQRDTNGHVVTERQTGWSWNSLQGALLSIQEMGVFVVQCDGDEHFEETIIKLGERKRDPIQKILPARPPTILGRDLSLLCSLPGIGLDRAQELLRFTDGNLTHAFMALTDLSCNIPGVGPSIQRSVKHLFRLADDEMLISYQKENGK